MTALRRAWRHLMHQVWATADEAARYKHVPASRSGSGVHGQRQGSTEALAPPDPSLHGGVASPSAARALDEEPVSGRAL